MTFVREAWPFVLPPLIAAGVTAIFGLAAATIGLLVVSVSILLFFRNPRREFDGDPGIVLAPADGRILRVDELTDEEIDGGRYRRIVTFLSVFNVHVQRCPVSGEVVTALERQGAKVAAFRDDAGDRNQQRLTVIRSPNGDLIGIRQIAGLVARRVVGYLQRGQPVKRGELLGVIKFGSRVDLLVPPGYKIDVQAGDRVKAGLTPMARRT